MMNVRGIGSVAKGAIGRARELAWFWVLLLVLIVVTMGVLVLIYAQEQKSWPSSCQKVHVSIVETRCR